MNWPGSKKPGSFYGEFKTSLPNNQYRDGQNRTGFSVGQAGVNYPIVIDSKNTKKTMTGLPQYRKPPNTFSNENNLLKLLYTCILTLQLY